MNIAFCVLFVYLYFQFFFLFFFIQLISIHFVYITKKTRWYSLILANDTHRLIEICANCTVFNSKTTNNDELAKIVADLRLNICDNCWIRCTLLIASLIKSVFLFFYVHAVWSFNFWIHRRKNRIILQNRCVEMEKHETNTNTSINHSTGTYKQKTRTHTQIHRTKP